MLYFKLVNNLAPLYLTDRLPPLTSSVNPYHRRQRLERYTPYCRTELYKTSFFPSATTLWNSLPDEIKQISSLSVLKRHLSKNDSVVPKYYYLNDRISEIIICKLRLKMSDLKHDLFRRHITNDPICSCGDGIEDARHFLLECPLLQDARARTLEPLLNEIGNNEKILLFGDINKNIFENKEIFHVVGKFIFASKRFSKD